MNDRISYEQGILNQGNNFRLKNVMERASRKENITIAFLGGSITQGFASTEPTLCYAGRTFSWWKNRFPETEFKYINAGIGATDSEYGVARLDEHVLRHEPDLVFVEFSVNDENTEHYKETYESLVRKLFFSKKKPAVILLHNVYYENGKSAQEIHTEIAKHYDLPSLSAKETIYRAVQEGKMILADIAEDGLHPTDKGHEYVAKLVCFYLEHIMGTQKDAACEEMPGSLTRSSYEKSLICGTDYKYIKASGFVAVPNKEAGITEWEKDGFWAARKGDEIEFVVPGENVAVQYRKTACKSAPMAEVIIDGNRFILDANFEEDWGDKLELQTILKHGKYANHHVVIRIIDEGVGEAEVFFLKSVIGFH